MSPSETFTAKKTSYSVFPQETFTDGIIRKVWSGDVISEATLLPSTVRMVWGTECDTQTFLLKKVSQRIEDQPIKVVKTIPCEAGSATDICIVEVDLDLYEGGPPLTPLDAEDVGNNSRQLRESIVQRQREVEITSETGAVSTRGRQLQSTTQIDILVLYTEGGLASIGLTTQAQMESFVIEEFESTNEAMMNSLIDLEVTVVRVQPLPYVDESDDAGAVLNTLTYSEDVDALRTMYGADLVHLITKENMLAGGPDSSRICGLAYLYTGNVRQGFGITGGGNCLDGFTHSHEVGHNMGCYHDIDTQGGIQESYFHGYRYCTGDVLYETIMSYRCGSVDRSINHFSNPDVSVMGLPTGVADEADCARRIRDTMDDVAGFRASASPETACSNGIAGVEASGMCCTLGCGTCGGPGCGSRGAADGLTAEDCCAWRIRDSGVFCDVSGTAPCIIDSSSTETVCSNGIAGVEASGMCCTLGCGTCGDPGCGSRGAADGLTAEDCCTSRIRDSGVFCDVSGTAPCIIDSRELLS
ncbi:unnamed protein product [Ascophyllum nodosum]